MENLKKLKNVNCKLLAIILISLVSTSIFSQNDSTKEKPKLIKINKGDTLEVKRRTGTVIIRDSIKKRTQEEEFAYQKLKRKVIKLYPYALLAKRIYNNSKAEMSSMGKKRDRKKYRKAKEQELRDRFEEEVKSLYTSDGPILVKLIHRETGSTTFDIIKDIKGGFKTMFYQMAAKRHGYSLKSTFDPVKDKDIEGVVTLLQSEGQLPIYNEE